MYVLYVLYVVYFWVGCGGRWLDGLRLLRTSMRPGALISTQSVGSNASAVHASTASLQHVHSPTGDPPVLGRQNRVTSIK